MQVGNACEIVKGGHKTNTSGIHSSDTIVWSLDWIATSLTLIPLPLDQKTDFETLDIQNNVRNLYLNVMY